MSNSGPQKAKFRFMGAICGGSEGGRPLPQMARPLCPPPSSGAKQGTWTRETLQGLGGRQGCARTCRTGSSDRHFFLLVTCRQSRTHLCVPTESSVDKVGSVTCWRERQASWTQNLKSTVFLAAGIERPHWGPVLEGKGPDIRLARSGRGHVPQKTSLVLD